MVTGCVWFWEGKREELCGSCNSLGAEAIAEGGVCRGTMLVGAVGVYGSYRVTL